MKVPLQWLKEYVDIDVSAQELGDMLTFGGLEIEAIDTVDGEEVLTVEVTPNRPDCLSMIGIAREVGALYDLEVRVPDAQPAETGPAVDTLTSVTLQDPCPRYTARVLQGVSVGPSPDWMQKRLTQCDVRPINNLVDITNYVLLECGQPLHAFDHERLAEGRIVVRRATDGETMTTLDDVERKLDGEMLLIADAARGMAVAGVMGGADSEIHDGKTQVLLESACFDTTNTRATSRKLGLTSESAYRFERGVDPELADYGSRRAAALILEHAGATLATGVIDERGPQRPAVDIDCRYARVRSLIGVDIADAEIRRIFTGLQFGVQEKDAETCTVTSPTFRYDLEIEADLIEEVARVHGLRQIPAPPPNAIVVPGVDDRPSRATHRVREILVGLGLTEGMSYSFLADRQLDLFDTSDREQRIRLPNPISQDQAVMRSSLVPQLVESLGRNRSRQIREAALFEIGRTFARIDGKTVETDRVAVGLLGPAGRLGFDRVRPVTDEEAFLWIKGILEALAAATHAGEVELAIADVPYADDGLGVSISLNGSRCGQAGIVRKSIASEWRVSDPLAVLEVELSALTAQVFAEPALTEVPAYPPVSRDLAIILEASVKAADVEDVIRRNGPAELTEIALFDIYSGKGVGDGKKSFAYALTYQSATETLTDDAANAFHAAIMDGLEKELSAQIRGR